jgi:tRNA U34 5-methylaminomethyl-2-thiouridine-forming methyltransferase MnmC
MWRCLDRRGPWKLHRDGIVEERGIQLRCQMHSPDDDDGFDLVTVQSGARSLRSRRFAETFHPVVGPMAEAIGLHVRQPRLVERAAAAGEPFVIWDVGLGAAANAVAVLEAFENAAPSAEVQLHSIDHTAAPLAFAIEHATDLGYLAPHAEKARELLREGRVQAGVVEWRFHRADFRDLVEDHLLPAPHAIVFDPYSPRANPQMWTLDLFARLRRCLKDERGCLLSNYTRSTAVRVTLLLAGFFVGRGHATGEKDQTTIASNCVELLEAPLDTAWLERVRRSTSAAPLGGSSEVAGPITPRDWEALVAHPQFAWRPGVEAALSEGRAASD